MVTQRTHPYRSLTPARARIACLFIAAVSVLVCAPARGQAQMTLSERVNALTARSQSDSAIAILDSALTASPGNVLAQFLMSDIRLNLGDTSAAIHVLDAILKANPSMSEARNRLVRVQLARGDVRTAAHLVDDAPPLYQRMTDAAVLAGDVQRALGHADSAISLYRTAYDGLTRRDFIDPPLAAGQRLAPFDAEAVDGTVRTWIPGKQTLLLLWSRYCPASESALAALPAGIKQAAVSWHFIPMNVEYAPSDAGRAAVAARVRALGCKDSVWFAGGWRVLRSWSIDRLPCLVLLSYTGIVSAVYTDWNDEIKERLFAGYLGPLGDTARQRTVVIDSVVLKGERLYAGARDQWSRGQVKDAIRLVSLAIRNRPDFPLYHVQLASYRWQAGDTAGARLTIDQARRIDSSDVWVRVAQARLELADADAESAIALLRGACDRTSPAYGTCMAMRALASAQHGDWPSARDALAICRTMNPFNPHVNAAEALVAEADSDAVRAADIWRELLTRRMANTR